MLTISLIINHLKQSPQQVYQRLVENLISNGCDRWFACNERDSDTFNFDGFLGSIRLKLLHKCALNGQNHLNCPLKACTLARINKVFR